MSLLLKILAFVGCLFTASVSYANEATKQTEFGGVKLGTKATSLGFKLDDFRAWYIWKNKYQLSGTFSEDGHPIYSVTLSCKDAGPADNLSGISCSDTEASLKSKLGASVMPMCSTYKDFDWEDQIEPTIYYSKETNRFWLVDYKTRKVLNFGISLPDIDWARCAREFSAEEISKIKIGVNAKSALKENLRSPYRGFAFLRKDVKAYFTAGKPDSSIYKIQFSCEPSPASNKDNQAHVACGMNTNTFVANFKTEIVQYCDEKTMATKVFYRSNSKEYWAIGYSGVIDSFGFSEAPDLPECSKFAVQLRMAAEARDRKPNTPPLPLRGEKDILRIKGITLGDRPDPCPKIETVSLTTDRINVNVCVIREGDNQTLVYFDASKSFVVKIDRTVFVDNGDAYLSDALNFYGNLLTEKEWRTYEFGDPSGSRGLKLVKHDCYFYTNGCVGSSAKFRFTFTMVDVGAFREALEDGRKAYRKKEF